MVIRGYWYQVKLFRAAPTPDVTYQIQIEAYDWADSWVTGMLPSGKEFGLSWGLNDAVEFISISDPTATEPCE